MIIPISGGGNNLALAVSAALPGSVFLVKPGSYAPVTFPLDRDIGPIQILIDESNPENVSAPVVINAGGAPFAMDITGQSSILIDGLTFREGTDAGVHVSDSVDIFIQNCTVKVNRGDGIRFENTDTGDIFDNLLFDNGGTGILLNATSNVRVVNNTVTQTAAPRPHGTGIVVDSESSSILLENNIVFHNVQPGISVAAADTFADFNLNRDGYAGIAQGTHDLVADPVFAFPNIPGHAPGEDLGFFLFTQSPAVNTGDPDTDFDLLAILEARTTDVLGLPDLENPDIGYHYSTFALPQPTPTKVPKATPTQVRSPTPTRTPTRTPTHTPAA